MLGEENRNTALDHQPFDQRNEFIALSRCHAGGRLVHQQKARLVGERDGKLDALDIPVCKLAAWSVGGFVHADLRQKFERAIAVQFSRSTPELVSLSRV